MSLTNQKTGRTAKQERNLQPGKSSILEKLNQAKEKQLELSMESENQPPIASIPDSSTLLKEIAEYQQTDAQLALMKAQSAELLRQINNYQIHYQKFENIVNDSILKNRQELQSTIRLLEEKINELENSNQMLPNEIDRKITPLLVDLNISVQQGIASSYNEQLKRVNRAVDILQAYVQTVKQRHQQFESLQGIKMLLFTICCLSSPILTILLILEKLHIL